MSLWRNMCREAAGVVRSIRYDLGLLKSRRGRPTRRLVIAVGVLTVLAAGGVGTVIAVVDALGGTPADRAAVAADGTGAELPDDSDGVSLSGVDRATGSARISPSAGAAAEPHDTGTASPSPTPTPGKASPTRTSPTRTRPPAPTPTSPRPSSSPSPSESPSTSDSPSTSSTASPARTS